LSCKKGSLNDCTKDAYAYEILVASKIDTLTNQVGLIYQINPGNNLVFRYVHIGPDCKNIADEEYTEYLVFQISPNATSFEFRNSQLKDAFCFFNRLCFCAYNASGISSGTIKGTKVSTTKWNVEINVDLPGSNNKIILNKVFSTP
jgi:hypothetical protein